MYEEEDEEEEEDELLNIDMVKMSRERWTIGLVNRWLSTGFPYCLK